MADIGKTLTEQLAHVIAQLRTRNVLYIAAALQQLGDIVELEIQQEIKEQLEAHEATKHQEQP